MKQKNGFSFKRIKKKIKKALELNIKLWGQILAKNKNEFEELLSEKTLKFFFTIDGYKQSQKDAKYLIIKLRKFAEVGLNGML